MASGPGQGQVGSESTFVRRTRHSPNGGRTDERAPARRDVASHQSKGSPVNLLTGELSDRVGYLSLAVAALQVGPGVLDWPYNAKVICPDSDAVHRRHRRDAGGRRVEWATNPAYKIAANSPPSAVH